MQRTLGSKSLAEGQKGIVFAAFLKLLMPFAVVLPGIMAFNLYIGGENSWGAWPLKKYQLPADDGTEYTCTYELAPIGF